MKPIALTHGAMTLRFHPSYAALIAAEAELGSLFALVESAAEGRLKLADMIALLWHCRCDDALTRDGMGALAVDIGLARITPLFRQLIEQALGGA